ncbi:hypothetical protein KPL71_001862 [Citrus sinensis]|uniref:Uncharacterized protein n=1 Tax=Citrus sinensis TaxID=2711 RepID=A0ACB8NZQ8_CITSI|nr:hypothetical protein KPL71_001862 [Citrus sinensis]
MKMSPFGMGWLVKYFRPRLIVDGIHLYGDLVELSAVHPLLVCLLTSHSRLREVWRCGELLFSLDRHAFVSARQFREHGSKFVYMKPRHCLAAPGFSCVVCAIELSILAAYYGREIVAYDIQTTRCDFYGQEKKYSERVMLIYDELHYDALAISAFEGAPVEFDQS